MQVKSIAILLTFIKLSLAFKTFVFSISEWPLKTDFTVCYFIGLFHICKLLRNDVCEG